MTDRIFAVGIGFNSRATVDEMSALIGELLTNTQTIEKFAILATIDTKRHDARLSELSDRLGCAVRLYSSAELAGQSDRVTERSQHALETVGTPSVAEAAALCAAGPAARLWVSKRTHEHCAAALAGPGDESQLSTSRISEPADT